MPSRPSSTLERVVSSGLVWPAVLHTKRAHVERVPVGCIHHHPPHSGQMLPKTVLSTRSRDGVIQESPDLRQQNPDLSLRVGDPEDSKLHWGLQEVQGKRAQYCPLLAI